MKKTTKIQIAKRIIKLESNSLNSICGKINSNFEKACDLILSCNGRVITVGIGKSGHIAAKAAATLSSTGTPSMYLHGSDCLHGDMGAIKKNDVVIFFSNSGETRELMLIIPLLKILKVKTICITGSKSSKLAKASDIVLDCGVSKEACPLNLTPTSSVIAAIGMSDALALTLLECRGFTSKDFARSHPHGSLGKRLLKKVSNVMITKKLPIVSDKENLYRTIKIMTSCNFGFAIITNAKNQVSGVFSDGDLRRVLQNHADIKQISINDVMSKKPTLITEDVLAAEVLSIMEKKEITTIPVTSKSKKILGIITLNNILRAGIE